jgi:HD-like signal output (HDOD) protein
MDETNGVTDPAPGGGDWIPLRSGDMTPEIMKRAREVLDRVPDLPVSVHRVIEMASDPDTSPKEIAEIVSSDPVFASNILMMVNSSYYGLSRKIDNLKLAIVLLGFNEVRGIAVRCGLSRALGSSGGGKSIDTGNLWSHSYLVGQCAEYFAGDDDPQKAGTLLTLGLLHDIGKFVLYIYGTHMKQLRVRPVSASPPSPASHLLEKEEHLFGVNHAVLGGLLARRWNLSDRICTTLECHHQPSFFEMEDIPKEYLGDIAIVCISDLIVNRREHPEGRMIQPRPGFYELLGFDPDRALSPELEKKLDRARRFIVGLK